jgi:hypothetical protein
MSASPDRRPRHRAQFRPRFTLMVIYFALFFLAFALLLALPGLLEAFRSLPAGEGPLSPQELELARDAARQALQGRLVFAFVGAALAIGIGVWQRALPGLR